MGGSSRVESILFCVGLVYLFLIVHDPLKTHVDELPYTPSSPFSLTSFFFSSLNVYFAKYVRYPERDHVYYITISFKCLQKYLK